MTSSMPIGCERECSQRGKTISGSRAARSRTISQDVLPNPQSSQPAARVWVRGRCAGSRQPPVGWRGARHRAHRLQPPRYTIRARPACSRVREGRRVLNFPLAEAAIGAVHAVDQVVGHTAACQDAFGSPAPRDRPGPLALGRTASRPRRITTHAAHPQAGAGARRPESAAHKSGPVLVSRTSTSCVVFIVVAPRIAVRRHHIRNVHWRARRVISSTTATSAPRGTARPRPAPRGVHLRQGANGAARVRSATRCEQSRTPQVPRDGVVRISRDRKQRGGKSSP